jgi:hypothetical protein
MSVPAYGTLTASCAVEHDCIEDGPNLRNRDHRFVAGWAAGKFGIVLRHCFGLADRKDVGEPLGS